MGQPGSVKRIEMAIPIESAYVTVAYTPDQETHGLDVQKK